jgi:hypothetical protein
MRIRNWLITLASTAFLVACASTDSGSGSDSSADSDTAQADIPKSMSDLPEVTEEGLHLVHNSQLAVVYVDPEADLSGYTEVQILEVLVSFRKNWRRDQNRTSPTIRVSENDMNRMRSWRPMMASRWWTLQVKACCCFALRSSTWM